MIHSTKYFDPHWVIIRLASRTYYRTYTCPIMEDPTSYNKVNNSSFSLPRSIFMVKIQWQLNFLKSFRNDRCRWRFWVADFYRKFYLMAGAMWWFHIKWCIMVTSWLPKRRIFNQYTASGNTLCFRLRASILISLGFTLPTISPPAPTAPSVADITYPYGTATNKWLE